MKKCLILPILQSICNAKKKIGNAGKLIGHAGTKMILQENHLVLQLVLQEKLIGHARTIGTAGKIVQYKLRTKS